MMLTKNRIKCPLTKLEYVFADSKEVVLLPVSLLNYFGFEIHILSLIADEVQSGLTGRCSSSVSCLTPLPLDAIERPAANQSTGNA